MARGRRPNRESGAEAGQPDDAAPGMRWYVWMRSMRGRKEGQEEQMDPDARETKAYVSSGAIALVGETPEPARGFKRAGELQRMIQGTDPV